MEPFPEASLQFNLSPSHGAEGSPTETLIGIADSLRSLSTALEAVIETQQRGIVSGTGAESLLSTDQDEMSFEQDRPESVGECTIRYSVASSQSADEGEPAVERPIPEPTVNREGDNMIEGQAIGELATSRFELHPAYLSFQPCALARSWTDVTTLPMGAMLGKTSSSAPGKRSTSFEHQDVWCRSLNCYQFSWVVHPHSIQRRVWDVLSAAFVLIDLLLLPLWVFNLTIVALKGLEVAGIAFWVLDIGMSFRTGFFVGMQLEMNAKSIAKRYAKGQFLFDLFIVVIDAVFTGGFQAARVQRFARCARIVRTFKASRITALSEYDVSLPMYSCIYFAKVSAMLGISVHYMACAWYFIGRRSKDGWVYAMGYEGKGFLFLYMDAARWTLAQINGRTDQEVQRTMAERMYTSACAMLGIMFMSLIVSKLTTTMVELSALMLKRNKASLMLSDYFSRNDVSSVTMYLARQHVDQAQTIKKNETEEEAVLALLPECLQRDILYETRSPALVKVPFFSAVDNDRAHALRSVCAYATRALVCQSYHVVFEEGCTCTRMLCVVRGRLCYAKGANMKKLIAESLDVESRVGHSGVGAKSLFRLSTTAVTGEGRRMLDLKKTSGVQNVVPGDVLSEAALWLKWKNTGDLLSTCDCLLLAVDTRALIKVVRQFADDYTLAGLHSWTFWRKMEETSPSDFLPKDFGRLPENDDVLQETLAWVQQRLPSTSSMPRQVTPTCSLASWLPIQVTPPGASASSNPRQVTPPLASSFPRQVTLPSASSLPRQVPPPEPSPSAGTKAKGSRSFRSGPLSPSDTATKRVVSGAAASGDLGTMEAGGGLGRTTTAL